MKSEYQKLTKDEIAKIAQTIYEQKFASFKEGVYFGLAIADEMERQREATKK